METERIQQRGIGSWGKSSKADLSQSTESRIKADLEISISYMDLHKNLAESTAPDDFKNWLIAAAAQCQSESKTVRLSYRRLNQAMLSSRGSLAPFLRGWDLDQRLCRSSSVELKAPEDITSVSNLIWPSDPARASETGDVIRALDAGMNRLIRLKKVQTEQIANVLGIDLSEYPDDQETRSVALFQRIREDVFGTELVRSVRKITISLIHEGSAFESIPKLSIWELVHYLLSLNMNDSASYYPGGAPVRANFYSSAWDNLHLGFMLEISRIFSTSGSLPETLAEDILIVGSSDRSSAAWRQVSQRYLERCYSAIGAELAILPIR